MHPLVATSTQLPPMHDSLLTHAWRHIPQFARSLIRLTQPASGHDVSPLAHDDIGVTHALFMHVWPMPQQPVPHAVWPVMQVVAPVHVAVTGVERLVVVPSPSWPWSLSPQHRTSPLWRRTQV